MVIAHLGHPWSEEAVVLLRKYKQLFADLSARYYRIWQCYNAMMLAIDYKGAGQLLFGSDIPMQATAAARRSFLDLGAWGKDAALRRIPDEIVDDILYQRLLSQLWP